MMRRLALAMTVSMIVTAAVATPAAAQGTCRVVDPNGAPPGTPIPVREGRHTDRVIGYVPNGHVFHYTGMTDGLLPGTFAPAVPVHNGTITIFGVIDPDALRCPP